MSTGKKYATGNPVMGYNIPSRGKVVILSLSGFLLQKLKSSAGSVDCLQCACNLTLPYLTLKGLSAVLVESYACLLVLQLNKRL